MSVLSPTSLEAHPTSPTARGSPMPTSAKTGSCHHQPTNHFPGINSSPCSTSHFPTKPPLTALTGCLGGAQEGLGGLHSHHQHTVPCTSGLHWDPNTPESHLGAHSFNCLMHFSHYPTHQWPPAGPKSQPTKSPPPQSILSS